MEAELEVNVEAEVEEDEDEDDVEVESKLSSSRPVPSRCPSASLPSRAISPEFPLLCPCCADTVVLTFVVRVLSRIRCTLGWPGCMVAIAQGAAGKLSDPASLQSSPGVPAAHR